MDCVVSGSLRITTLRNEPTMAPKRKLKIQAIICMVTVPVINRKKFAGYRSTLRLENISVTDHTIFVYVF